MNKLTQFELDQISQKHADRFWDDTSKSPAYFIRDAIIHAQKILEEKNQVREPAVRQPAKKVAKEQVTVKATVNGDDVEFPVDEKTWNAMWKDFGRMMSNFGKMFE